MPFNTKLSPSEDLWTSCWQPAENNRILATTFVRTHAALVTPWVVLMGLNVVNTDVLSGAPKTFQSVSEDLPGIQDAKSTPPLERTGGAALGGQSAC